MILTTYCCVKAGGDGGEDQNVLLAREGQRGESRGSLEVDEPLEEEEAEDVDGEVERLYDAGLHHDAQPDEAEHGAEDHRDGHRPQRHQAPCPRQRRLALEDPLHRRRHAHISNRRVHGQGAGALASSVGGFGCGRRSGGVILVSFSFLNEWRMQVEVVKGGEGV